ncbi:DUF948 domain-containing protein [Cohnella candidum]|uniref:DUF948 domain-containing protein n=1 Tax=Cohnella candidum TaxID=2674991 RepID=UPI0013DE5EB6|nr:DUF948 domain-containing protein [Cohnella candidum]
MNTNAIIAWSVAVAAVAFAALCVYLVTVLKDVRRSLVSAKSTVDEVNQTIGSLQGEIQRLTHTVNGITSDVQGKLQATDPLFDAVRDVGVMLRDVTGTARETAHSFSRAMRRKASEIDSGAAKLSWLRYAALGMRVVSGLKNGWQQASRKPQTQGVDQADNGQVYMESDDSVQPLLNVRQQTDRESYDPMNL